MEIKFKLLPPMMPNFVRYEKPARPRQEGFDSKDQGIPIEEFTEQQAKEYAELMRDAFIEHWRKRKANASDRNEIESILGNQQNKINK